MWRVFYFNSGISPSVSSGTSNYFYSRSKLLMFDVINHKLFKNEKKHFFINFFNCFWYTSTK